MRHLNSDGTETINYTPSERTQALNVSLTQLASSLGYTPVRVSSECHRLKEMDSLVIFHDRTWNRFSGKGTITGGSTIDFMLEYGGATNVPDAIDRLCNAGLPECAPVVSSWTSTTALPDSQKDFVLPPRNDNFKRVFAYLTKTRCISPSIVRDFLSKGLIYEDSRHHNAVLCGNDRDGITRCATMRGTCDLGETHFKADVSGSDKRFGFNVPNVGNCTVKVFEAAIDLMSYIDLTGDTESNKIALGMTSDRALTQFLQDYPQITAVTLCLDNDEAGQKAVFGTEHRQGLAYKYQELGYDVSVEVPGEGKDFNEWLCAVKRQREIDESMSYKGR